MTLAWNHCCAQLSGGRGVWTSTNGTVWSQLELTEGIVQGAATDGDTIMLGGFRGRGAEAVLWVSSSEQWTGAQTEQSRPGIPMKAYSG